MPSAMELQEQIEPLFEALREAVRSGDRKARLSIRAELTPLVMAYNAEYEGGYIMPVSAEDQEVAKLKPKP
jgi:hypothetical protein